MFDGGLYIILTLIPASFIILSLAFKGKSRLIYFLVIIILAIPLLTSYSCSPQTDSQKYLDKVIVLGPHAKDYKEGLVHRSSGESDYCVRNIKFFEPFYIKTGHPITQMNSSWVWPWESF